MTVKSLLVVLAVAVVALGVIGFLIGWNPQKEEAVENVVPDPTGTIYLSLASLPASENPLGIYIYDVENRNLSELLPGNATVQYLTSSISPSGRSIAYASFSGNEPMNIYVAPLSDASQGEAVTFGDNLVERNPSWSPDGNRLAFMSRADLTGNTYDLDTWNVSYVDLANPDDEIFVTEGVNPVFTPEGDLIVLKSDGLYLFDLETLEGKNIWEIEGGVALANMKLAVSPDGTKLAWSVSNASQMIIAEVHSWDPFQFSVQDEVQTTGYWPVFSSDNNYLAWQEIDPSDDNANTNPRLVLYNLSTGAQELLLDLSAFDQGAMFVTDWR